MGCDPTKCGIASLSVAIVSAALAISMPFIVNSIIDNQLRLQDGTMMYKFWQESPLPMYIRFYMFNVTNSEDVLVNKSKPILQQLGPYTYQEIHKRVNINNYDNFTLQFQQERYWMYMEDMSEGSLDDLITTINVPLLGASNAIRYMDRVIKAGFNSFVKATGSTVFVTRTVSEFLFEGYADPLLNASHYLPPNFLPDIPDMDRFGWFYGRNGSATYDGVFNIYNGVDDISKLALMDLWNYNNQTRYYEGDCGRVNGSFGEGWPPRQQRTKIEMYSTDLCRSFAMHYTKDVSKGGVTFYRYAGTKKTFASVNEDPDNWCFCTAENDEICSRLSGVVNSTTCRYGAPAFVSFPHFYLADPFFLDQVEGLNPQQDLHELHVDLEPRMSVPLQVNVRLQINTQMFPIDGVTAYEDVPEVFLPVLWFEVTADLSDKLLSQIHFALIGPTIGSVCFFVSFVVCLAFVGYSGVKYAKNRKTKRENRRSVDSVEDQNIKEVTKEDIIPDLKDNLETNTVSQ